MKRRYLPVLGAAAVLTLGSLGLVACGGGDEGSSDETAAGAESADGGFVAEMVPHHESAIEMAEIASERGENPEVRQLAADIIASQGAEIAQMERAHERLFDAPLGDVEHESLGLSEEDAGMSHDIAALEEAPANEFDMEFINMMIPHHQGAIRMARIELADGEDAELKEIAAAIIAQQTLEIEEMNRWHERWFGEPSPAGGVPDEGEEASTGSDEAAPSEHEEMSH